jgi:hypothetical protein
MPGLNLEHDPLRPKGNFLSKNRKLLFGAIILLALPVIGTTLAASITLGTNNAVQFGQGVAQATGCDSSITITPVTSFTNSAGSGSFYVDTITIGNIADTCTATTMKLNAYGDSSSTKLTLGTGGASSPSCSAALTIASGGNSITSETSNTCVATIAAYSANNNTVYFKPPSGTLSAATVYKFTIETS